MEVSFSFNFRSWSSNFNRGLRQHKLISASRVLGLQAHATMSALLSTVLDREAVYHNGSISEDATLRHYKKTCPTLLEERSENPKLLFSLICNLSPFLKTENTRCFAL